MARERPRLDPGPAKRRAPIGPLCPESGQTGRRLASPLRANSRFEQSQQKLSFQANRLAEDKNPLLPLTKKVLEFCGYSREVPARSAPEVSRLLTPPIPAVGFLFSISRFCVGWRPRTLQRSNPPSRLRSSDCFSEVVNSGESVSYDRCVEPFLLGRVLINPVLSARLAECPLRSESD